MRRLQETLGHVNDLHFAQQLIGEIAARGDGQGASGRAAAMVVGWHLRGAPDGEAALVKQVRRLRKTKRFWRPMAPAAAATISDPGG